MKAGTTSALVGALTLAASVQAHPQLKPRVVDTRFPYTGPAVPIGDWVGQTVNGNGKGFPRLHEAPAVTPATSNPTNNVNVISLSFMPSGVNVHYQTPFGLGAAPTVKFGTSASSLNTTITGQSVTYGRTPSCSAGVVVACSEFFHDVQLTGLKADTTYYYQIMPSNGTTMSQVLSFTTARAAGNDAAFSVAVLNDMGYTNAQGTYQQLNKAVEDGVAFLWHGGDLSYADDWYSGILPCEDSWPLCYNGTSTELPNQNIAGIPAEYLAPLPADEIANQGGPQGGDMNVIYESNWDLWQQWLNNITTKVPYMVLPGNHEAACAEFDGPGNILTAYLNDNLVNATVNASALTYYSCPPSQRNFTAFQNRFNMQGAKSGGQGNFWYSFDYGNAHFVSLDGETDFAYSPEWPFARDVSGKNETLPKESETFVTDAGPFGAINGSWSNNAAYRQVQWLQEDLAKVNRTTTPWIIAMSHRPMYSSEVSSYQKNVRNAFEGLLLQYGVDAYMSGHIHWYERMFPIGNNTIDYSSVVNNHTYLTNPGKAITHIVNGAAGNIESHSTTNTTLNITAVLDQVNYGYTKLNFYNNTHLGFEYVHGNGGVVGDSLMLIKRSNASANPSTTSVLTGNPSTSSAPVTTTDSSHTSRSASTGSVTLSGVTSPITSVSASTTGSASSSHSASASVSAPSSRSASASATSASGTHSASATIFSTSSASASSSSYASTVAPVSGSASASASASHSSSASVSSSVSASSSHASTVTPVSGSSSASSSHASTVVPVSGSTSASASSSHVTTLTSASGSSASASTSHASTVLPVSGTCAAPSTVTVTVNDASFAPTTSGWAFPWPSQWGPPAKPTGWPADQAWPAEGQAWPAQGNQGHFSGW